MEPPTKRPRVGSAPRLPVSEDEPDEDGDELNFQPHEVSQMRDPDYQLAKKREAVGNRFQAAMSNIFEKYGRDFGDAGDEIDFETGEVVVDNGHLANMRYDGDIGSPGEWEGQEGEDDEDEGIRLEDMPDEWDDASGASGEGHAPQNLNDEEMTTLTSLSLSRDSGFGPNLMQPPAPIGGLPWNMGPHLYYPGPGPPNPAHPAFFNGSQPSNFPHQLAWGSHLPMQVPPFGPSAGFYPPLPGDYVFSATPLSSKKTERRIQRSQFTSRFRTKGTVPGGADDAGQDIVGQEGSSAKDNVQDAPRRAESGQLTDDEDELNFKQLFNTFITENPINNENPTETPAVSQPAEPGLGQGLTGTPEASKSVVVELPEMVLKDKEQYADIRQNNLYDAALTPPKSVIDISESDGEQNALSDQECRQSENGPSHSAEDLLPTRTEIASPQHDRSSPSPGVDEQSRIDEQAERNNSDSEIDNDPGENDQAGLGIVRTERLGSIELGEAVTVPRKSLQVPEPQKERTITPPIEVQDSQLRPRSTSTAKRPSRKPAPPTNTQTLEQHLTRVTKPQSRTTTKVSSSPAIKKSPKKQQASTPTKPAEAPLTPRHRDVAAAIKTPSSRRSILSLLSDEEDDEILLSEKHVVSIPSLFSSSRRKKWKSRADLAKSIYQTPTKKRTSKKLPAAAANSNVKPGVCGVEGYTCGKDFCFTCS